MRCAVALLVVPGLLAAQHSSASISVGALSLRYAGDDPVSLVNIAPLVTLLTPTAYVSLGGTLARFPQSGISSQGVLEVASFTQPTPSGAMGEVGLLVGGSSHSSGVSTGQGMVSARLRLLRTRASAWIGAGAGTLWNGDEFSGVRETELGLSMRAGVVALTARVAPTVAVDSLHYTDVVAGLTWSSSRVDWSASLGNRAGARSPIAGASARTWGSASASFWMSARTALVVAGGSYPVDLTQGFPAGEYLAVSLRLGGTRQLAAAEAADARAARRVARRAGVESFEIRALADGAHELRVYAPRARTVDWLGDPTQWQATPLTRLADGWWSARFAAEGTVELVLSLNGGAWVVPPGVEAVMDEFGGQVGRLTLPAPRV